MIMKEQENDFAVVMAECDAFEQYPYLLEKTSVLILIYLEI